MARPPARTPEDSVNEAVAALNTQLNTPRHLSASNPPGASPSLRPRSGEDSRDPFFACPGTPGPHAVVRLPCGALAHSPLRCARSDPRRDHARALLAQVPRLAVAPPERGPRGARGERRRKLARRSWTSGTLLGGARSATRLCQREWSRGRTGE